ncbi:MAG: methionyl-tRNA formyltransferase [Deltaproteobacteria bacterium]|nr:MAG: methionyl-tRNA formyltransferase [Deltaproteobacteria bacterium]
MNPPRWRIVFMGTPSFAVPSLETLIHYGGVEVAAVVTQPDRPKGRGLAVSPPPIKVLAEQAKIPVLQPEKIRTENFLGGMRKLSPQVIIVVAYGKILPPELLAIPPRGAINVHASLLPKYRGAAPIQWALINGEETTGVTIMQLDEGMDTGPIFLMEEIKIEPTDTTGTLHDRLASLGARALIKTLDGLQKGTIIPRPQPKTGVSYAPMLKKEDGRIDWRQPAGKIFNLIRGLDPWPGSYSYWRGKLCHLYKPRLFEGAEKKAPGEIIQADDSGLLVATGSDYILITELKIEGSRRMAVADFRRGHKIDIGEKLG